MGFSAERFPDRDKSIRLSPSQSNEGQLLLSYYGDDFTGSTDSMEALVTAGIRTILFLKSPPDDMIRRNHFGPVQAIGVAGFSRSLPPDQMASELSYAFHRISRWKAPIVHYKVCSTFDSSPETGNIGKAIDVGQAVFQSVFVPLVVGVPLLRRYCVFGNLFAALGEEIFRLDRHPTMRTHPVTPMRESDLRVHLSFQTRKSVGLFDILDLAGSPRDIDERFAYFLRSNPEILLFDVLDDRQLIQIGRLIWAHRASGSFVVGSSGVEYALASYWREAGLVPVAAPQFHQPGRANQLVVLSGSCSHATQEQITWAMMHGFVGIPIDTIKLVDDEAARGECQLAIQRGLDALAEGSNVVFHLCLGPKDPRVDATNRRAEKAGQLARVVGERLGAHLGFILAGLLERAALRRVLVIGGDTSGRVARALGISALEMLAPTAPGAPLCRVYAEKPSLNGLEIVLKGGQVGRPDYFNNVLLGTSTR